jgi:hypothetical protein
LRARRIAERFLTLKASALYNLGRYEEASACARDATRGPTAAARIDDLGGFAKLAIQPELLDHDAGPHHRRAAESRIA